MSGFETFEAMFKKPCILLRKQTVYLVDMMCRNYFKIKEIKSGTFLAFSLQDLPYVVMTLIVAFTLHEFAHAYVAYLFGDHTAKSKEG